MNECPVCGDDARYEFQLKEFDSTETDPRAEEDMCVSDDRVYCHRLVIPVDLQIQMEEEFHEEYMSENGASDEG